MKETSAKIRGMIRNDTICTTRQNLLSWACTHGESDLAPDNPLLSSIFPLPDPEFHLDPILDEPSAPSYKTENAERGMPFFMETRIFLGVLH